MRRYNSKIALILLALLLVHLLMGACIMLDILQVSPTWKTILSYTMVALLLAHAVIGILLMKRTLTAKIRKDATYVRQNKSFWVARWSGIAIIPLVAYHIWFFTDTGDLVRLKFFGYLQMASSILLVLCILTHLLTNLRGFFVSLGLEPIHKFVRDTALILLIACSIGVLGFIVYYLRWNIWWQ